MAQFQQAAKENEGAVDKKREDMAKSAGPLDGNALGQALLKDLRLLS